MISYWLLVTARTPVSAPPPIRIVWRVKITNITTKKIFMIYLNQLEIMLFPNYYNNDPRQRELLTWLAKSARLVLGSQSEIAKKINLRAFKEIPAIYLS